MRDLNAQVARLCKRMIPEVGRGKFWERRYAQRELPRNEDIEEYFFYSALQAVRAGLAEHPRDYPGYNSFEDAVNGIEREFTVTDWTRYMNARRWNPKADITRYQTTYSLVYTRLPGYEHLSQAEYRDLMYEKLEQRRLATFQVTSQSRFQTVRIGRRCCVGEETEEYELASLLSDLFRLGLVCNQHVGWLYFRV